jgi:hypothetical protein
MQEVAHRASPIELAPWAAQLLFSLLNLGARWRLRHAKKGSFCCWAARCYLHFRVCCFRTCTAASLAAGNLPIKRARSSMKAIFGGANAKNATVSRKDAKDAFPRITFRLDARGVPSRCMCYLFV